MGERQLERAAGLFRAIARDISNNNLNTPLVAGLVAAIGRWPELHTDPELLCLACRRPYLMPLLTMMVAAGAHLDDAVAPLETAIVYHNPPAVIYLLGLNVDVNGRIRDLTPLLLALQGFDTEIARVLVEAGADVNAPDVKGVTPLHMIASITSASDHDMLQIIVYLCDHGANRALCDRRGRTAYDVAVDRRQSTTITAALWP